jgi:hypothetical protein
MRGNKAEAATAERLAASGFPETFVTAALYPTGVGRSSAGRVHPINRALCHSAP